ncbi:WD repeat-containing protein 41-like isoform X1 [Montipora foliosa]|uniref:WD repeat-containing protein 41-like isoform X1 n=2 Tax=Montipora foliosa TaxID=591990 RepID=UPI0035F1D6D8
MKKTVVYFDVKGTGMYAAHILAEGNLRKHDEFHDMGTSEVNVESVGEGSEKLHSLNTKNKERYPCYQEQEIDDVPEVEDDQPRNPFTELRLLSFHTDIVHLLTIIDERRFASASDDNLAVIWDAKTGRRLSVLKGHSRPIKCMLLLHQRQELQTEVVAATLLLTGSSDRTILVWDVIDGQCLHSISEHCGTVKCLVNMKHDNIFVSGGQDLCVWNEKGELLDKLIRSTEHSDVHSLLPIKNNRIVAASNKSSLVVYSIERTTDDPEKFKIVEIKKLSPHREAIRCLINVADSMFASASLDGAIVLWSSHSLSYTRQFNYVKNYEGPSHTYPSSTQHVFTVDQRYIFASIGHGFFLYDAMSDKCLAKVPNAHHGKILHSLLLCEGYVMATCSEDGSVKLWGSPNPRLVCNGSQMKHFTSHVERFLGLSVSEIQNLSTPVYPALLGECVAHSGAINVAINLGGEGFASCGSDGLVVLWKDGVVEKERRNDMVRNILLSMDSKAT